MLKKALTRSLIFFIATILIGAVFSLITTLKIFKVSFVLGIILFIATLIYSLITGDTDY